MNKCQQTFLLNGNVLAILTLIQKGIETQFSAFISAIEQLYSIKLYGYLQNLDMIYLLLVLLVKSNRET